MPIEDGSIAFSLDRGLFHSLNDDDGKAYASELARVLKSGAGVLLRGSRLSYNGNFNPITSRRLRNTFSAGQFSMGAVIPLTMVSDADRDPNLEGAIVVIRRK